MDISDFKSFQLKQPEKVLIQILGHILDELKTDHSNYTDLGQKSNLLKSTDLQLHDSFNKLHIAWMAYSFTRQDKELKMKMEDVWEGQLSMYRQVVEAKMKEMTDLMKQRQLKTSMIVVLFDSLL